VGKGGENGSIVEMGKGIGDGVMNAGNMKHTELGARGKQEIDGGDKDRVVDRLGMQGIKEVDGVGVVSKDGDAAGDMGEGGYNPVKS
jgi:hypothetical protein